MGKLADFLKKMFPDADAAEIDSAEKEALAVAQQPPAQQPPAQQPPAQQPPAQQPPIQQTDSPLLQEVLAELKTMKGLYAKQEERTEKAEAAYAAEMKGKREQQAKDAIDKAIKEGRLPEGKRTEYERLMVEDDKGVVEKLIADMAVNPAVNQQKQQTPPANGQQGTTNGTVDRKGVQDAALAEIAASMSSTQH